MDEQNVMLTLTKVQCNTLMEILEKHTDVKTATNDKILKLKADEDIWWQLRQVRRAKEIQSTEIAKATGYDVCTISRIELGKFKKIGVEKLYLWAKALGYEGVQIL